MGTQSKVPYSLRRRLVFVVAAFLWFASHKEPPAEAEPAAQTAAPKAGPKKPAAVDIAVGREIFLREWLPNDPRSHGGDGLGPVFNDTSCVACHNLGGGGGGGAASKNVDIVTAAPANPVPAMAVLGAEVMESADLLDDPGPSSGDLLSSTLRIINGIRLLTGSAQIPVAAPPKPEQRINVDELAKLHPGFRKGRSIVLPRFGTEPEFEKWHPANSDAFIDAAPVPQPAQSIAFPSAITAQSEFHPLLKAAIDGLLQRMGVKLEPKPEAVPQSMVPPAPVAVSRTIIMERRVGAMERLLAVGPQGNEAAGFWSVGQSLLQTAQWLVDIVAMPFDPDNMESDLPPEAMVAQFSRSTGGRSGLIDMNLRQDDSTFGAALKKAHAQLVTSRRNPTALFGAGLIDSIPDSAIEATAAVKNRDFPLVRGRVNRLRDGRIGKFGWKGQTASLRDFTLTACAVELGLNVPGHEQALVPYKPDYRSPGFDLTEKECDALVAYLASLPAPSRPKPANEKYAAYLDAGEKLFAETGCAACHTRKLGDVDGIYSDLLLHDMGPALADSGNYGSILPEDPDEDEVEPAPDLVAVSATRNAAPGANQKSRSPRRAEWRTPPLWGVRDSGPYLHDGGAETLQDAIAMHGGEALPSTNKYFKLSHEQRQQLIGFLKSLTAPEAAAN